MEVFKTTSNDESKKLSWIKISGNTLPKNVVKNFEPASNNVKTFRFQQQLRR